MPREYMTARRALPPVLALILAMGGGCGAPYLMHLAQGQANILLTSKPIEEVIADPGAGPAIKEKLELVRTVKHYGETVVGLKADGSFTTFAPVEGPAALYVVTAAPKLELEPHTWTFPLVGTFPYKGFFDKSMAEAEEARLARAGFDTYLRPAAAYSTLGWFTDPVLEPLLASGDVSVANVILHEKTHSTIFVPNHVAFDEGLATFVGRQGAIDFFAASDGPGSPHHVEAIKRMEDERRFGRFLQVVIAELEGLYGSDLPGSEKLERRERIFEKSRLTMLEERDGYNYPTLVEFYTETRLNNAFLVTLKLYTVDMETYVMVYERHGRDLAKTVEFFKGVGRLDDDPAAYMRRWLDTGGARAAAAAGPTL